MILLANIAAARFRHPLGGTPGFVVQHIVALRIAHIMATLDGLAHAF
jgi:hypothetical protein